jgi:hypothetical protein
LNPKSQRKAFEMTINIPRLFFICRQKLVKWLQKFPKRTNFEFKEQNDYFSKTNLEVSGHLFRQIPMDEKTFRYIESFVQSDAKAYFLYAVLSEVVSSCLACMRIASQFEEDEDAHFFNYPKRNPGNETMSADRMHHLFEDSRISEFEVRFRKLQEYLCYLICFSETNDEKYFKLFLASRALEDIKYASEDIKEFFGKPMENFNFQSSCPRRFLFV